MRRIRIKGVNDMKEYAFGIDLGGTTAKVGLFTTSGKLLEKWEVSTDTSNNGAHILENLAAAVQQKMQEKGLSADEVEGVGLGVPGPVLDSSIVPIVCANLGGWGNRNVSIELSELLGGILKRAIDFSMNRLGDNGMPAGLWADWNDCLRLGKRGESTFVAMQLYYAMTVIKYFAEMKDDAEYIDYINSIQYKMGETIQEKCWEDDRFIRGYKEGGQVIGSKNDPEASMWLNPQSWAVISGLATRKQSEIALESVHRELNTEYGVRLMFPPYREHAFDGALMLLFNAGTKENAGIFSQPQGWIILAEALMGHGNRAFEYFNESSPASMNDKAEIRKLEPYCHGQFTESVGSPFEGRAHVHWLTGTASTCMVGCVEGIMGMRPDFGGIKIAPSVPSDWKEFEIEKMFRGKKLSIKVQNPDGHESGFQSLTLNGEKLEANYIPADKLADTNDIVLVM